MRDRPDIPIWPDYLLRGMREIELTFRRLQMVYRPRLMRGPKYDRAAVYQPVDTLMRLLDDTGFWRRGYTAEEVSIIAERNIILITGGFND